MPGAQQLMMSYGATAGFDAATVAWVAAVFAVDGTVVSTPRKTIVDNLIVGLKADSLFTKLDRLWLLAAENSTEALVDIIADVLATAVGAPTFTTVLGYTGQDAVTPTKYITSGFNPSTNGVAYTANAAHVSAWSVTNTASISGGALYGVFSATSSETSLYDTYIDGNLYARINDAVGSGSQGAPGTRAGHWIINRSDNTHSQAYQNGSLFSSPNATGAGLTNSGFFILCSDNGSGVTSSGTPNQIAMISMGGNFSGTNAANFYTRLRTYMTAVGVP